MKARAKINLFLHVLGRRSDGYHRLESLMAPADVGDDVEVAPATTIGLSTRGPFAADLPPAEDNLVIRAARRLADYVRDRGRTVGGAEIRLTKNLPPASGIGGASADAAAALILLERLWKTEAGDDLRRIAASLGADVPFCLDGRASHRAGIGDEIRAVVDLADGPMLLVHPGVSLATAAVFDDFRGPFQASISVPEKIGGAEELLAFLASTRNALSEAAIRRVPVIAEVLASLAAQKGCRLARMSGSGAACFALFDTRSRVEAAAAAIRGARPEWWVCPATLLGS